MISSSLYDMTTLITNGRLTVLIYIDMNYSGLLYKSMSRMEIDDVNRKSMVD